MMVMWYVIYFRFCGWRYFFIYSRDWARIKDDAYVSYSSPGGGTTDEVCYPGRHLVATCAHAGLIKLIQTYSHIWYFQRKQFRSECCINTLTDFSCTYLISLSLSWLALNGCGGLRAVVMEYLNEYELMTTIMINIL